MALDFGFEQTPVPVRYMSPAMARIWSQEQKYRTWAKVETAAARALGAPSEALEQMQRAPVPTLASVAAREATTGHDVVAFLEEWKAGMEPGAHEWVHRGMTSSDLVDSALAYTLQCSRRQLDDNVSGLIGMMAAHAVEHEKTRMVGRTHGRAAEMTTWGYRVADIVMQLMRAFSSMNNGFHAATQVKLSGPVGNYRHTTREQERSFSRDLIGVTAFPIRTATQVVARDGLAELVFGLAQVANAVARFAQEVRLCSQSGIDEMMEGAARGRAGSSAMPHKMNPVTSENLMGLARLVRAQVTPMLEDALLWNERDISHSSVERVALPTAVILTDTMATSATSLVAHLEVDADAMSFNLYQHEAELSSATARNWLVKQGLDPAIAWSWVRRATVLNSDRFGEKTTLAHSLAKIGRASMDYQGVPKDFAPNWTDLIKVCTEAVSLDTTKTEHIFSHLRAIIATSAV